VGFHDVAHQQAVRAGTGEADRDVHLLEHPLAGAGVEGAVELQREVAVLQAHSLHLRELDHQERGAIEQRHLVIALERRRDAAAHRRLYRLDDLLDHRDATRGRAAVVRERHPGAAQRVQDLGQVAAPRRQGGERRVGPALGVERHRHADRLAALGLDHGQALQEIVDLVLSHLDGEQVAVDLTDPLEVADAVPVQDDPREGQPPVGGRIGGPAGRASGPRGEGQGHEQGGEGTSHGGSLAGGLTPRERGEQCGLAT
jgi:hypothetical protein